MSRPHPHPDFLGAFAETRAFTLGRPSRIQITADGSAVLFLRSGPRSPEQGLYELDVATGTTRELVTPQEVLGGGEEVVSAAEQARRERQRITDRGFTSYSVSPDGQEVLLPLSGQLFLFSRRTRQVRTLLPATGDAPLDPRFSPDGRRVAFVRGGDLCVVPVAPAGATPVPVTRGGGDDLFFGLAEFVAQEEMSRHEGYWWSPDGTRIAFTEVDQREVERFSIADPARPERPPASFRYPRPGKANARVRLGIATLGGDKAIPAQTTWVVWDQHRYPYLARVLWETPRAPLAILVQTRDQRETVLLAVDEASGATRPLVVETDEAWVNLDKDLPHWLPNGAGLLWASERSGRRALELRAADGRLVRTIAGGAGTAEADGFLSLVHVSPDARTSHVLLGNAVVNRLVRLDLATGAQVTLTNDQAEHAPLVSRDARLIIDVRVAADALPEVCLLDPDGKQRTSLPQAAEAPPFRARPELLTVAGEGGLAFHAAVLRPHDFDPARRYPVVVHVYGGPHALMVKADERHYLLDQWIADHGAIVVCVDNRGTPRRDRAWERAVKGRFGEVPLDDQVTALHALARRFPQMDLGRVGIYGWSFGGYMAALAVLRRPDVFKVAVAGAPVVDWLDYDTHYTERYLDLPDVAPQAYADSSLLGHAAGLRRPLLLVHGTADDNVYFFHSLKLAEALFRAGCAFDFLPLPRVTHQIADATVRERLWERVVRYLLAPLGVGD